jgi:hypothetical protein
VPVEGRQHWEEEEKEVWVVVLGETRRDNSFL